ncbi:MAG: hypothetical protein H6815_07700 [Phycisphaeraceae bacterium]|nr:hypothetical protein [Phycisphaerales bacterium]MCB9860325.1 hypothetical protein [Phycisphaeraceae bacterium]
MTHVVWIFSLPRSGTSVTAYACAAPWNHAIADEVLGPWDRTGEPYNYPQLQRQLCAEYMSSGCRLTPNVVSIANELFAMLDTGTGVVISKHPHLRPSPDEFRRAFPEHRAIWLMRNPLPRVNSLIARGWTRDLRPNFEIERFRDFARIWIRQPERMVFETMRKDRAAYFRSILTHWGLDFTEEHVRAAAGYTRSNYHANSKEQSEQSSAAPVSEKHWHLPDHAVRMYHDDSEVRSYMKLCGYPTKPWRYRYEQNMTEARLQRLFKLKDLPSGMVPDQYVPDDALDAVSVTDVTA